MYSIPVHCESHGGWGMLHGVVHLEEGRIRLEYQLGDAVLKLLRSESKEVIAGFDALAGVQFRSGFLWLAPAIELAFADFKLVSQIPAGMAGKLRLRVPRADRAIARKFVAELERELSWQRQRRLERDIERLSTASPPYTAPEPRRSESTTSSTPAPRSVEQ